MNEPNRSAWGNSRVSLNSLSNMKKKAPPTTFIYGLFVPQLFGFALFPFGPTYRDGKYVLYFFQLLPLCIPGASQIGGHRCAHTRS